MSININLKIEKRDMFLFGCIAIFLLGAVYVIAYNPNWKASPGNPAIQGHTPDEIVPSTTGFCNTVDTYNGDYGWTGYGNISMLIDDRNICEDGNGCTYRIWRYTAAKPAGANFYTSSPVMLRQIASHNWHDGYGNQIGINGDGTVVLIVNWDDVLYIWDDNSVFTNGENSPDALTWRDASSSHGFLITLCDY